MTPHWAADLMARIAVPRLVGSPGLTDATAAIASQLQQWGFVVQRQEFAASSRRLTAAALGAAGIGWTALVAVPLFVLPVPGSIVLLVVIGLLGLVGTVSLGVARGYLPAGPPTRPAWNVVATAGDRPVWWLVAHADSKSQRFSLRSRVIAVAVLTVGLGGFLAMLGVRLAGPLPWAPVFAVATLVAGAAGVLSATEARNASPGAVDNASGVIAALAAAERLRTLTTIGVLITSAEELGMEGARAWSRSCRPGDRFVNFDGWDGRGPYRVVRHATCSAEEAGHLARVLAGTGIPATVDRLPPGVWVDGVTLARAGLVGVTVSRGDWTTLGVVHTARDLPDRVDLSAVVEGGGAVGDWVAARVR